MNDNGSFQEKWATNRLDEVSMVIDSLHKTPKYQDTGLPMVRAVEIKGGFLQITDETKRVSQSVFDDFTKRYSPKKGDILFGRVGAYFGRSSYVATDKPFCIGQNTAVIIPSIDSRYLFYTLNSPRLRHEIKERGTGSSQPTIGIASICDLPIPTPPVDDQKAIAHILGSLDDKIELNRKMNGTLESMAQAMFKSWFVDFDPVIDNALAAGNPIPEPLQTKAQTRKELGDQKKSLPPDIQKLFPDSFEQRGLVGVVPKQWKSERFDKHLTVTRGLSYKGAGLADAGMPMHNLNSIFEGGGYKHVGIKFYKGDFREKHIIRPGDLIISNTEQGFDRLLIGYAAIVPTRFGEQGIFSHHIYKVAIKEESPFTPAYLLHLVNCRRWHEWISGFSNGTTINMLPMDALQMPLLALPPKKLIDIFSEYVNLKNAKSEKIISENDSLTNLRDTLLPKLLSGELRIPDAEKLVAEAV